MDHLDFVNKSLRLRYEAFSKFATHINQAKSLETISLAIASDIKFVIDAFIFRLTMSISQENYTFELFRGECTFYRNHQDILTPLEKNCLENGLPLSLEKKDIESSDILKGTLFNHAKTKHLIVLPIISSNDQKLVLFIASKSDHAYNEMDFRFAHLISELLTTKISQLLLIRKIGENYKTLAEANQQLSQLNEEVRSLNSELEIKVEERTYKLKEAHHELNTLFYRTSHDFRRPLSAILGLISLIEMNPDPQEVSTITPHLKSSVLELDRMLHKLQTISLTEVDDEAVEAINFQSLLESVKEKFSARLQENHIRFTYHIQQQKKFFTHPMILEAILENIIENCICYCASRHPFIKLSMIKQGASLCIQVTDNGDGIPDHLKVKVFDMYTKTSERSSGNGLGLYIVKKLVEKLKGTVYLESTFRKGTSVMVTLPYREIHFTPQEVKENISIHVSQKT
ncbi:sensor histidine kinase [Catalinimonas niigatensis]|uniref:sensor histidine kinase n=1 Tax=Catalinimonas niigatensis TaxID=1397264 RepID=UPI0026665A66|nr:GAF domain-containing sensor histidine kinase [Catalinimonas niigatensis]WPP48295.1 GAF domain-containing sensor histidine kinase [Catalinimonas niigatensis]